MVSWHLQLRTLSSFWKSVWNFQGIRKQPSVKYVWVCGDIVYLFWFVGLGLFWFFFIFWDHCRELDEVCWNIKKKDFLIGQPGWYHGWLIECYSIFERAYSVTFIEVKGVPTNVIDFDVILNWPQNPKVALEDCFLLWQFIEGLVLFCRII